MRNRIFFSLMALAATIGFTSLGVWQLERRIWKHHLIAQVEAHLSTAPVAAPAPSEWATLNRNDEYQRVTATGHFLPAETPVLAVTNLGRGYWILSPFQTDSGFTILINRGFVPTNLREASSRPANPAASPTVITGLLRLTEPKGAFLHTNNPTANRWYSRDVAAIATSQHISPAAPYFIDADVTLNHPDQPVGGLTVIHFNDNHLSYALTWFTMAVMSLCVGLRFGFR